MWWCINWVHEQKLDGSLSGVGKYYEQRKESPGNSEKERKCVKKGGEISEQ